MQRKIVYVGLYEAIAIVSAGLGLSAMSGAGMESAGVASVLASAIAVAWNLGFNTLFEAWEARQATKGRSIRRRIAHAVGFEGGLAAILVPVFAWWFDVGLWQAFVMDFALLLFFLAYTFVFNWAFDQIFGLPASATRAVPAP